MAYIGNDPDGIFIPGTVNTSTSLSITGGSLTQTGGDVNLDSGTLFVDESANRVGILTTTPGYTLDVNGEVAFSPNIAGKNTFHFTTNASNDASLFLKSNTTDKVNIQANGPSYFNGGNVGVGTTSPLSRLHVEDSGEPVIYIRRDTTSATSLGGPIWRNSSFNVASIITQNVNANSADLTFSTSSGGSLTERARIDSLGNVGIGTTSPSYFLHTSIYGNNYAYFANTRGSSSGYIGILDDEMEVGTASNHPLTFTVYSSEKVRIDSSGNVGIGTTNPTDKLHIYGGRLELDNALAGQTAIQFNQAGSEMAVLYRPGDVSNSIRMYVTGGGDVMSWTSAGNVGIGTNAPGTKLSVYGGSSIFQSSASGSAIIIRDNSIENYNRDNDTSEIAVNYLGYNSTNTYFRNFTVYNGKTSTIAKFIGSTGNIGIGVTNPSWKTEILSGSSGVRTTLLTLRSNSADSSTGTILRFVNSTSSTTTFGVASITALRTDFATGYTDFVFENSIGNSLSETLRIKANGNVGIGTDNPTSKLYVMGDIFARDAVSLTDSVTSATVQLQSDISGNYTGWKERGVASGSMSQTSIDSKTPTINDFTYPNSSNGILIWSTSKIGFAAGSESPQFGTGVQMLYDASGIALGGYRAFDRTHSVSGTGNATIKLFSQTGSAFFGMNNTGSTSVVKAFTTGHDAANRGSEIRLGMTDGSFAGLRVQTLQGSNASYNSQNVSLLIHNGGIVGDYPSVFCKYDGQVGIGTTDPCGKLTVLASNAGSVSTEDYNTTAAINICGTPSYVRLQLGIGNGSLGPYGGWIQASYDNTPGSDPNATGSSGVEPLLLNPIGGNVGIATAAPFSKLQVGSHTFTGSHGMYANDRVGISNHGGLTGLMLASTYNDSTHPEYGLVFVQGPNTSNYNVWSISPQGPALGNKLEFIYGANATNIHTVNPKVVFSGDGNVGIGTTDPDQTLDVRGAGIFKESSSPTLYLDADTSNWPALMFQGTPSGGSAGTQMGSIGFGGVTSNALELWSFGTIEFNVSGSGYGNADFAIDTNGNVDVHGNVALDGTDLYYTNTYNTNGWGDSGNWYTVVPDTMANNSTYLVVFVWDWNGSTGQPYYLTGQMMYTTVNGTNGTGVSAIENAGPHSSHTGSSSFAIDTRIKANNSGNEELQVRLSGFSSGTNSYIKVKVWRMVYKTRS